MQDQSRKPIWWKAILGFVLILAELNNIFHPAPNLLKADDAAQQAGMDFAMIAIIGAGIWLLYSAFKPTWRKTPGTRD